MESKLEKRQVCRKRSSGRLLHSSNDLRILLWTSNVPAPFDFGTTCFPVVLGCCVLGGFDFTPFDPSVELHCFPVSAPVFVVVLSSFLASLVPPGSTVFPASVFLGPANAADNNKPNTHTTNIRRMNFVAVIPDCGPTIACIPYITLSATGINAPIGTRDFAIVSVTVLK